MPKKLLSIFGIGPWSVNMFQIFCLGNLDIFSSKDAGLRLAMNNCNYTLSADDSVATWSSESLTDQDTYTRLNSFFIRFDLTGQIGQKPKLIEKISYLDFINISKVPFYELSFQYISSLNSILKVNVNVSDQLGISITNLNRNTDLKGNWMPDNLWWSLNYRANF